jgi:DNA-directed RNA polymerase specialized sigma24 family protein
MDRDSYLAIHRQRRDEIAAAVAEGWSYAKIAKAFGISPQRVGQVAKKAGVAPKARGGDRRSEAQPKG